MYDNEAKLKHTQYEELQRFISQRITDLRLKKGVSEYRMSYDLGHNKNYIRGITMKYTMPSLEALLEICVYFELTPAQFFEGDISPLIAEATGVIKKLDDKDIEALLVLLKRFGKKDDVE